MYVERSEKMSTCGGLMYSKICLIYGQSKCEQLFYKWQRTRYRSEGHPATALHYDIYAGTER